MPLSIDCFIVSQFGLPLFVFLSFHGNDIERENKNKIKREDKILISACVKLSRNPTRFCLNANSIHAIYLIWFTTHQKYDFIWSDSLPLLLKMYSFLSSVHCICAVGKTRTKDKYRVVYTDYQRLELEKEYHMSRYITIRRKSELAQSLQLSERQVKIWFQNRRAKERKQSKKRDDPSINLSNGSPNIGNGLIGSGLSLQHHNMAAGGGLNGLDFKPKIEPGLGHHASHLHNLHHHHSMHQLSPMGMNLHNPLSGLHLHHSSGPPTPMSPTSNSSLHQQHTHLS